MSLISFLQEAGQRLFHHDPTPSPAAASGAAATAHAPTPAAAPAPDVAALNRTAADAIKNYVASQGLPASAITVAFDGASRTVSVSGTVPDQATKEKIVLCCGNVAGVRQVDDQLKVTQAGDASDYYTVKSGDTLSKIAQHAYGAANRYSVIFEANKPMLTDPDKIYPGQVLRIPKLA